MTSLVHDFLGALLLFAPAGIANAAPVLASKLPGYKRLQIPLDGGKTFRGKRIFGQNKSIGGLLSGIVVGAIVGAVSTYFINRSNWLSGDIDLVQGSINLVLLGALLGFAALAGDAVESFFKRQRGVKPGKPWFPFDQIDYILGGLVVALIFVDVRPIHVVLILFIYTLLHPVLSFTAYLLKLKKDPF